MSQRRVINRTANNVRTGYVQAGGSAGRMFPSDGSFHLIEQGKTQEQPETLKSSILKHDTATANVDEIIHRLPAELTVEQIIKAATLI